MCQSSAPRCLPCPSGRRRGLKAQRLDTLLFWLPRLAWNFEEILCKTPQGAELKLPPHQFLGSFTNSKIGWQCQVGHQCRPWALRRYLGDLRDGGKYWVGREQWSSPTLALVPPSPVELRVLQGCTHPSTGTPAVVQSRPTHKLVLAGKDHWSPTQAVGLVPQHQAHRKRGAPQEGRPAIGEISVRPGLE